MVQIVRKTISRANMPSLTEDEYAQRADDWIEGLIDHVPLDRLQEAYARADRDHASEFPVNYYEIKNACVAIQSELAKARREEREADPVAFCDMKANHINEYGDVSIALGGVKEITVPCQFCRRTAYDVRIEEEMAKFRAERQDHNALELAENPAETITATFEKARTDYIAKQKERPVPKTAIGWFIQAKLDGGDPEMLDRMIDHEKAAKRRDEEQLDQT